MEEPISHFSEHPDYLLTMTQATKVLGYKDYRMVKNLVDQNLLVPLQVSGSKRLRFRYHDVMNLAKPRK